MPCSYDPDADPDRALSFAPATGTAFIRMWNRHRPTPDHDDSVEFCVEIGAADMSASLHGVTVWGDELAAHVEGLAADFAGWNGTRTWRTPDGDLEIASTFMSGGHVRTVWTLTRAAWTDPPGARAALWCASAALVCEAGEELRGLAADIARFTAGS